MKKLLGFFRNTVFLGALCLLLLTTTIGAITWGIQTAALATAVTSKAVAKAVMKTKAKARIRRAVVAIPVVGIGAIVYFEERNYKEWKVENPDGTRQEYGCEVVEATALVMEEVLQELPKYVRPAPENVFKLIPKCESEEELLDGA